MRNELLTFTSFLDSENEKETDHNIEEINQSEIQDDPNMVYTCEMCDTTFSSVQEHLAKYHEGEEVLLVSFVNFNLQVSFEYYGLDTKYPSLICFCVENAFIKH